MTKRKSRERDGKNSHQPFVLADTDVKPIAWPKSAPPPIGCPLNDEGTQRILDKVGGRFVPHGLELGALRDDLRGCYISWCSLRQQSSDKIARQRVQRLETIAKRADAVLELLDEGLIGGWARQEIAMTLLPNSERIMGSLTLPHRSMDSLPVSNAYQQPRGTRPNISPIARCTGSRVAHSSSLLQTCCLVFSSVILSARPAFHVLQIVQRPGGLIFALRSRR
jgi:hypothetical protein